MQIDVLIIGCGTPKFSMGWTHLFQLLQPPLNAMCTVAGVVEPFFLSDAGRGAPGHDLFRAFAAEHPSIPFVGSVRELPPPAPGRARVAVISVRTADARRAFEESVLVAGCRAVYLEKPGGASASEIDALVALAARERVVVEVGYSRNCGAYVRRGLEFLRANPGLPREVTLVHSNHWRDDELPAVFARCRPGLLFDMACHDLALAAAHFGLTASGYTDLRVDPSRSLQATHGGVTDFVRVAFTLRPAPGCPDLTIYVDRQDGAYNGMECGGQRFLSGDPPVMYENPLPDLSPHLAVQYDYYVEAKRILLAAVAAGEALPPGTPTLEVAREALLLAEKLTVELQSCVPFQAPE